MILSQLKKGSAVLALSAVFLLSGCNSVADWDCAKIAEKATELSQAQPIKFTSITGVRETSRNDTDARCTGEAQLAGGDTGTVYLRAYEEGSNIMVAYQGEPFP